MITMIGVRDDGSSMSSSTRSNQIDTIAVVVAGGYLERFFTGVLSNVCAENARRRERFAAVDAFVWTFSAVYLAQPVIE